MKAKDCPQYNYAITQAAAMAKDIDKLKATIDKKKGR